MDTFRRPIFSADDYQTLHRIVFAEGYPGYKPTVKEIPNGDGKVDVEKRFAHVAPKYFTNTVRHEDKAVLQEFLQIAHDIAEEAAFAAGIPFEFFPDIRYGALRVLEYPAGEGGHKHEDFDLFTLMCHRDQPDRFYSHDAPAQPRERFDLRMPTAIEIIRQHNRQAHLGQLGEAIGLGKATPHEVLPSETAQHSIVYFAIPDHDSLLPPNEVGTRLTVRDWLNERMARSRTEFKKYE